MYVCKRNPIVVNVCKRGSSYASSNIKKYDNKWLSCIHKPLSNRIQSKGTHAKTQQHTDLSLVKMHPFSVQNVPISQLKHTHEEKGQEKKEEKTNSA